MARPRYMSWILQAESDMRAVTDLIKNGHFAQACFNAQQAAEKALKALAFFRGSELVKSHSITTIAKDLGINGLLATYAVKLDLFYLAARYPDALPEHAVPSESFDLNISDEAFKMAQAFLNEVKKEIMK
ncbi:MAG: DNA-binding protein [Bdellovibrio sp.]|nr:MAG: DNA-binding protein [Bdellovibrio sp.]